jgi:hypothetical protein
MKICKFAMPFARLIFWVLLAFHSCEPSYAAQVVFEP